MATSYEYTQNWFAGNVEHWRTFLLPLAGRPNLHFLEIGCFEGQATVWLLRKVLTHETARIDCIDTFEGSAEHKDRGQSFDQTERRFDRNIGLSGGAHKVVKWKGLSGEVLRKLPPGDYDFVYVDGSHLAPDVLEDAVLSFRLLRDGGLMIFDDYEWAKYPEEVRRPKLAIDSFLRIYEGQYDLLFKAYQVVIRKRDPHATRAQDGGSAEAGEATAATV